MYTSDEGWSSVSDIINGLLSANYSNGWCLKDLADMRKSVVRNFNKVVGKLFGPHSHRAVNTIKFHHMYDLVNVGLGHST